jgi:hypothetical protein
VGVTDTSFEVRCHVRQRLASQESAEAAADGGVAWTGWRSSTTTTTTASAATTITRVAAAAPVGVSSTPLTRRGDGFIVRTVKTREGTEESFRGSLPLRPPTADDRYVNDHPAQSHATLGDAKGIGPMYMFVTQPSP